MAELSQVERALLDDAVAIARQLGRPFLPREIFAKARAEGYALQCAYDIRFVKTGEHDEHGRALWTIDESPERLQERYLTNIFSDISTYAERCYSQATAYAGEMLKRANNRYSGTRDIHAKSRDELIRDYLQERGWTLEDVQG